MKTPAQYVIDKFGAGCLRETARQLEVQPGAVHYWTKEGRGALSARMQAHVLKRAAELGIRVNPARLVLQLEG